MYIVEIREPNRFFVIKGKAVRSPFKTTVDESEIRSLKATIKAYGVMNYSISLKEKEEEVIIPDIIKPKKEVLFSEKKEIVEEVPSKKDESKFYGDVKIEELSSESSLLQKFISGIGTGE